MSSAEYARAWLGYVRRPEQVFDGLLVPALQDAVRGINLGSVLDVACGEGRLSRAMLGLGPGRLVACDFNSDLLCAARKELSGIDLPGPEIAYVEADVTKPFPAEWKGMFDLVGGSGLLHFLSDDEVVSVLRNGRESLTANGRSFSSLIHPEWAGRELGHWDESTPILVPFRGLHLKSYRRSVDTYCRLHERAGFAHVEPRGLKITAEVAGERFAKRVGDRFYLTITAW